MTQLIGRMTRDAVVNKVPDGREVVNFTLALNDWYKPKNGEGVKTTAYVNCAYWLSTKTAEQLKKSCLVEISGRIYVSAYTDMEGTARASLNCHVNFLKIHHTPKGSEAGDKATGSTGSEPSLPAEPIDDLPF